MNQSRSFFNPLSRGCFGGETIPPGTFRGGETIPPGTFRGGETIPPGTFR